MTVTIYQGDALQQLRKLADGSVNCVVTSPPYFGLRDYGTAQWHGGDEVCAHSDYRNAGVDLKESKQSTAKGSRPNKKMKCKCGAVREDMQIGLESSPALFIARLVEVFREVKRVMRDDGTCWLNMGDTYSVRSTYNTKQSMAVENEWKADPGSMLTSANYRSCGIPEKNLIGIPWRLAFALQDDGWILRQDIIWAKPNPMPESVTDRCTKSHEYMFLLTKSPRYFYDNKAIAEPVNGDPDASRNQWNSKDYAVPGQKPQKRKTRSGNKERKAGTERGCPDDTGSNVCGSVPWDGNTRNKRSVWTVSPKKVVEAHFATFPPELIEPCIIAGCPEGGVVLDPFMGSGTTGMVADRLKRHAIGVELNPEYIEIARDRLHADGGMFCRVEVVR